jgi:hypothetical protein
VRSVRRVRDATKKAARRCARIVEYRAPRQVAVKARRIIN